MPFLFVDYDQGAGGEHLSYLLSQTPQCVPLRVEVFATGRKKVHDRFAQEFLKPVPRPEPLTADPILYELVPSHRKCQLGQTVLGNIKSIRISNPEVGSKEWEFLKHNRLKKVLLAKQPSPEYFFGELRVLLQRSNNIEWLKHVDMDMDNLTLQLLSKDIEPTDENKKKYLEEQLIQEPEPIYPYDCVIPYKNLLTNVASVAQQLRETLGITIDPYSLKSYETEYAAFAG